MGKGFDFVGSDHAQHAAGVGMQRAGLLRSLGWCSPFFWSQGAEPAEEQSMKPPGCTEGRGGEDASELMACSFVWFLP